MSEPSSLLCIQWLAIRQAKTRKVMMMFTWRKVSYKAGDSEKWQRMFERNENAAGGKEGRDNGGDK